MVKINYKKTINSLNKFFRTSAKHSFLSFLILVFVALLLGGILFYRYNILVKQKESEIISKPVEFEENLYQKILGEWQKRGERFEEAAAKKYPDPFR